MKSKAAALAFVEIAALLCVICATVLFWARPLVLTWHDVMLFIGQGLAHAFCFVFSFYYNDLYDLRTVRNFSEFTVRLPQSVGLAFILLAMLYLVFPETSLTEGPLHVSAWSLLGVILVVLPLRGGLYALVRMSAFAERVLILGTSPLARKIVHEIESASHLGYVIVGFVGEEGTLPAIQPPRPPYPLFGSLDRLAAIIEEVRPDRIIVALAERRGRLPVRDLLQARMEGIIVDDGVEVYERFTGKLAIESLSPSFLIFSRAFEKGRLEMSLRRVVSLAVAGSGLVLTAPLLGLIALAIKLDSHGPVFFKQARAGRGGRVFRLIKFRTMRPALPTEEAETIWSRDDSVRITRVGKWLRKLRLDEIPQFLNILRGDMDLVGPRPEMVGNVETMSAQIPYYALRMAVRPGITGWAQIRYGYAMTQEDVAEKMRYDLYYVKNMSLWFDVKILFATVKTVLLGMGSEVKPAAEESQPELLVGNQKLR